MPVVPFSATGRPASWTELSDQLFDVAVIGGGITGCGVAREIAGRGIRVALLESGDFGRATSGASSRLIHGGLRYLETFEFGLVFESLRERRLLLEGAPHLVRPLQFLYPVYRGDSPGLGRLAAGMWLYDTLSLFQAPRRHRLLRRDGALSEEPCLRADDLVGGATYFDAQVDDARLTLAVARAARETGAVVLSYARVERIDRDGDSISTITVRDTISDSTTSVRARLVVNATGPWSDRLRKLADPTTTSRLRTTKGVHVLFERERVANRNAVIFRSRVDRRVMFVLPWGAFTYVGTTDSEFEGDPSDVAAEPSDLAYVLDSANGIFPKARLTHSDIVSTWAGVRPLLAPFSSRDLSTSATSREHLIWRDPGGLLNVAGGKLTTFRSMASEVAETAATILSREAGVKSGIFHSRYLRLPGAPDNGVESLLDRLLARGPSLGLDRVTVTALASRYGSETERILDMVEADRSLGEPISALPYIRAEIVYAVREEMALTIEDVARRRLHLFYELRDGGLSFIDEIASLMAGQPGLEWSDMERAAQISAYSAVVRRSRPHLRGG